MWYSYLKYFIASLFCCLFLTACEPETVNTDAKSLVVNKIDGTEFSFRSLIHHDTVYVPIYSDIYSESKDVKFLLTATLSIRNTSLRDTIYIGEIRYFNSGGNEIRNYLKDEVLILYPMQSVEYVIERNDNEGGTGANFVLNWATNASQVTPVFQGVMISTHGQQGISFITEGVSISHTSEAPADSTTFK